jgi:hypothetical protein
MRWGKGGGIKKEGLLEARVLRLQCVLRFLALPPPLPRQLCCTPTPPPPHSQLSRCHVSGPTLPGGRNGGFVVGSVMFSCGCEWEGGGGS